MSMSHRLQILLDEERYARVARAAREQRVSVATVIRDAIDAGLAPVDRRKQSSARVILGADPMEVPEVSDLLQELHALRSRRG